ncbi:hypothetical protein COLO4_27241 [Corchorus olitorius]|uniref:Uncharacterized protein n=1 Tax=Corchorus olitorius TaxID=93759 RepID=A0A1R3HRY6_9ROSI|nr:hypothetical protein COLO4_27241 [Corchorus olitorius]
MVGINTNTSSSSLEKPNPSRRLSKLQPSLPPCPTAKTTSPTSDEAHKLEVCSPRRLQPRSGLDSLIQPQEPSKKPNPNQNLEPPICFHRRSQPRSGLNSLGFSRRNPQINLTRAKPWSL